MSATVDSSMASSVLSQETEMVFTKVKTLLSVELETLRWCAYVSSDGMVVIEKVYANGLGIGFPSKRRRINLAKNKKLPYNSSLESMSLTADCMAPSADSRNDYKPIKQEASWGDLFEQEEFSWGLSGGSCALFKTDWDAPGENGDADNSLDAASGDERDVSMTRGELLAGDGLWTVDEIGRRLSAGEKIESGEGQGQEPTVKTEIDDHSEQEYEVSDAPASDCVTSPRYHAPKSCHDPLAFANDAAKSHDSPAFANDATKSRLDAPASANDAAKARHNPPTRDGDESEHDSFAAPFVVVVDGKRKAKGLQEEFNDEAAQAYAGARGGDGGSGGSSGGNAGNDATDQSDQLETTERDDLDDLLNESLGSVNTSSGTNPSFGDTDESPQTNDVPSSSKSARVEAMKKARYATRFPCSHCEAAFPSKRKLCAHLVKEHPGKDNPVKKEISSEKKRNGESGGAAQASRSPRKKFEPRKIKPKPSSSGDSETDLGHGEPSSTFEATFKATFEASDAAAVGSWQLAVGARTEEPPKPVIKRVSSKRVPKWITGPVLVELKGALKVPLRCNRCLETFNDVVDFNDHKEIHKSWDTFPCPKCPKLFKTFATLKHHMARRHPLEGGVGSGEGVEERGFSGDNNDESSIGNGFGGGNVDTGNGRREEDEGSEKREVEGSERNAENKVQRNGENGGSRDEGSEGDRVVEGDGVELVEGDGVGEVTKDGEKMEQPKRGSLAGSYLDQDANPGQRPEPEDQLEEGELVIPSEDQQLALRTEDNQDPNENVQKKLFPCGVCGKVFSTSGNRSRHNTAAHKGKKVICRICGKTMSGDLKTHMTSVHFKQRVTCNACGGTFSNYSNLRMHYKLHHMEHEHLCKRCGKDFQTEDELVEHKENSHNERKTFVVCKYCNKTFSQGRLKDHVAIVHEQRRFSCDVCGKVFTQKKRLNTHIDSVHEKKRIPCPSCSKSFTRVEYLRNHERKFHGGVSLEPPPSPFVEMADSPPDFAAVDNNGVDADLSADADLLADVSLPVDANLFIEENMPSFALVDDDTPMQHFGRRFNSNLPQPPHLVTSFPSPMVATSSPLGLSCDVVEEEGLRVGVGVGGNVGDGVGGKVGLIKEEVIPSEELNRNNLLNDSMELAMDVTSYARLASRPSYVINPGSGGFSQTRVNSSSVSRALTHFDPSTVGHTHLNPSPVGFALTNLPSGSDGQSQNRLFDRSSMSGGLSAAAIVSEFNASAASTSNSNTSLLSYNPASADASHVGINVQYTVDEDGTRTVKLPLVNGTLFL